MIFQNPSSVFVQLYSKQAFVILSNLKKHETDMSLYSTINGHLSILQ